MHPQTMQILVDLDREKAYSLVLLKEIQNMQQQIAILKSGFHEIEKYCSSRKESLCVGLLIHICKITSKTVFNADIVANCPDILQPNDEQSMDEVIAQCRDGCKDSDLK